MTFDVRQRLYSDDGDYNEAAAQEYRQQLMDLFVESPEGSALIDEGIEIGWAELLVVYSMDYEGVTPATMAPWHLESVVFSIFPRKVSAQPDEARGAILELRAFLRFLDREYEIENARECLEVLDDQAEARLARELGNPANFGMAKSFFMEGDARGFDLSSEEGLQQWVRAQNAEFASQGGAPSLPELQLPGGGRAKKRHDTRRAKRKMKRQSRKRNRRK